MKRALMNIIIIIYVVIAILATICLLSYNEYKVSVIAGKTLVIMDENVPNEKYTKGDLVIVGKEKYESAQKGDLVFFYENRGIKVAEIQDVKVFDTTGTTFVVDGNYEIPGEDLIGTSKDEKIISKVGKVLQILESKWGFLFLIVFPSLLAFLHEIYQLILEISNKK